MLKKSSIIILHNIFKDHIGSIIQSIKDRKWWIMIYDKKCDKNDNSKVSRYAYRNLNYCKNALRKDKMRLKKAIQMNRVLKNIKKNYDHYIPSTKLFHIQELQYMLSVIKKSPNRTEYSIADDYDLINNLKGQAYHHYKLAVPGTKKGMMNFLIYNDLMNQYRKRLRHARKVETAIVDLKDNIRNDYYALNNSGGKKSVSTTKKIKKKVGNVVAFLKTKSAFYFPE